ncbi:MAG TPA: Crp/Fnr family transcriptional regulator [Usitatibacter sp.]|nr:Crp/Fnr family transcriptional regulator [Usitatibacter sp.]
MVAAVSSIPWGTRLAAVTTIRSGGAAASAAAIAASDAKVYMGSTLWPRSAPGLIQRKVVSGCDGTILAMHAVIADFRAAPGTRALELLAHAPIFRGLPREDLARIASGTSTVHPERGGVLFRRGDPCEGFHFVVYGQVKLALVNDQGDEKVVEILGPGRSFGEAAMFSGNPYPVTATALADSLLLHVRRDTLFAELDRDPLLGRRMLGALSARLHMMVKDVEAMTLHSASQRVIGYLARLEDDGAVEGEVTLPAQKSLVASRLNLTPEYFSRILHDLAAAGIVRVDGRRIEILDPAGLREYGTARR